MEHHQLSQSHYLSVLCAAPADEVKRFADGLIPLLPGIEVLRNRTGLAMVPMRETAQGATFYLGEALIAEAHVRAAGAEGYAACLGRDLEQALAIALVDAAAQAGVAADRIAALVGRLAAAQAAERRRLLAEVEATRVEMETF